MSDAAAKALRDAAGILRERGWDGYPPESDGRGPEGQLCVGLALGEALWQKPWDLKAEACAALRRVVGGDFVEWNDGPDRTVDEVLAALEAAAVAEEARP